MAITGIGSLPTVPTRPTQATRGVANEQVSPALRGKKPTAASFSERMESALKSVDTQQHGADQALQQLASGEGDIHNTMIALEQANISMRTAFSARDKMIAAYEQIMNMAI